MKTTRKLIHRLSVNGLSHNDYALVAKRLEVGDFLSLRRDLHNSYDDKAIAVYFTQDDEPVQIGWIPKTENAILAKLLDAGFELSAAIISHDTSAPLDRRLYVGIYITALVKA